VLSATCVIMLDDVNVMFFLFLFADKKPPHALRRTFQPYSLRNINVRRLMNLIQLLAGSDGQYQIIYDDNIPLPKIM